MRVKQVTVGVLGAIACHGLRGQAPFDHVHHLEVEGEQVGVDADPVLRILGIDRLRPLAGEQPVAVSRPAQVGRVALLHALHDVHGENVDNAAINVNSSLNAISCARLRGMGSNRGSKAADQLRRAWRPSERRGAPKPPSAKGRATFHLPAELLDEMRNTVVALSGPPLRLTMSKLAANAIRHELDRLRRESGGSKRAFGQRAGEVTKGRPVGQRISPSPSR